MENKEKGIALTANMLATVIILVVAVFVIFMLWASLQAESGSPVSGFVYRIFDSIVGWVF